MIDLRPDQMATVRAILKAEVPDCEVWAFGSRAKWTAKDSSDLDLAIRASARLPLARLARLRQAFEDSYLPIKVDVVDLDRVSDEFCAVIRKQRVVLQMPSERVAQTGGAIECRTMPLEACMETIIDYRGKTPRKVSCGIPLITAKIVKGGRIAPPNEFIAATEYDGWMRRGLPRAGDVLLTMEAPLGEVAQLDDRKVALAQRLVALRGKTGLLDNTFLRYALQSDSVQDQLRARATGTTVLGIRQSELRKINLPIPPLPEQKRIAHILGTLDDKIELNRRINETLEAMARAIFKSWFVDFDPVAAKSEGRQPEGMDAETAKLFPDSFEDSEIGRIPKGWRIGTFGDVAQSRRQIVDVGNLPPELAYVGLEHMPRKSISLSEWGVASSVESAKSRFSKGDILFGKLRPYFHKVGIAPVDGICSTDILVIVPRKAEWSMFVLGHASSDEMVEFADGCSTGTRMPRVSWGDLSRYPLPKPPPELAGLCARKLAPILDAIVANSHECRSLGSIRDALLPRLLSGELALKTD